MEGEILKYGWLIVLTLGQIIYIWLRMAKERNNRKKECKAAKSGENPSHGERIATLEKGQEELEKDFEKFEKQNREDHQKIFDKLNRKR